MFSIIFIIILIFKKNYIIDNWIIFNIIYIDL